MEHPSLSASSVRQTVAQVPTCEVHLVTEVSLYLATARASWFQTVRYALVNGPAGPAQSMDYRTGQGMGSIQEEEGWAQALGQGPAAAERRTRPGASPQEEEEPSLTLGQSSRAAERSAPDMAWPCSPDPGRDPWSLSARTWVMRGPSMQRCQQIRGVRW